MIHICFVTTIYLTYHCFLKSFSQYLYDSGKYDISLICDKESVDQADLPAFVHYYPVKIERGVALSAFSSIKAIKNIFRKQQFDIVQYSTPNASLYASIAGRMAKVPVRLYCQWGLVFEGFQGLKRRVFMQTERVTCHCSTWIEPDSNGNLAYCRRLGFYDEKKSSVVLYGSAQGVNLDIFDVSRKEVFRAETREKYGIHADAFVFGFVGRLTSDKGTNELIEAFKNLSGDCPDARLLLVGSFEKGDSLDKDLIHWAKQSNQVVFTGLSKTVPKDMAAMDCYVMPSYREGFGMTVIEAGAMGLPVIASDIPGPTDVIRSGVNGLVVQKKNAVQLETGMRKLYDDRTLCRLLGESGRRIVAERYDQRTLFEAMLRDRDRLLAQER